MAAVLRAVTTIAAAALWAGCALSMGQQPDDGFRSRLAAGCETREACAKLNSDASDRWAKCQRTQDGRSCDAEYADRETTRQLAMDQRKREEAAHDVQVDRRHSDMLSTQREQRRLNEVLSKLHGECSEKEVVERTISEIPADVPTTQRELLSGEFRRRASDRRVDFFKRQADKIARAMKESHDLEAVADLDTVGGDVAQVRGMLDGLKCGEDTYSGVEQVRSEVDGWAVSTERQVATERACRASDECMAQRAAKPLCEAIREKRGHQEALAKERANPAGVVNLTYLHDLGMAIQDADAKISQAKKDYAKATKKPFSEARCEKR